MGATIMFYPWRILKGKAARRKITPPKSRWDPKAFRMPDVNNDPKYAKLKRIVGLGTNVIEILDYFEEEDMLSASEMSREEIETAFNQATELEKFEILDYILDSHLFAQKEGTSNITVGEAGGMNMNPREVEVIIKDKDSYSMIMKYIEDSKLTRVENPVSVSDYAKGREQSLYDYIYPRIGNEDNIEGKFRDNYIGPNNEVKVTAFFSEEEERLVPDGIANAMIGLLRSGSHFGYMLMDKYGQYKRGSESQKHKIERESEFPKKPHKIERHRDVKGTPRRWENFPPDSEDVEFWGWQQQLESSKHRVEGDLYDWSAVSVVKKGKVSGASEGKPKWYINFVAVFHGKEPRFWAGIKVEWDSAGSPETRQRIAPMLNLEIMDWRKW